MSNPCSPERVVRSTPFGVLHRAPFTPRVVAGETCPCNFHPSGWLRARALTCRLISLVGMKWSCLRINKVASPLHNCAQVPGVYRGGGRTAEPCAGEYTLQGNIRCKLALANMRCKLALAMIRCKIQRESFINLDPVTVHRWSSL